MRLFRETLESLETSIPSTADCSPVTMGTAHISRDRAMLVSIINPAIFDPTTFTGVCRIKSHPYGEASKTKSLQFLKMI